MSKLTESAIEDFAVKLLERLGYSYIHPRTSPPMAIIRNAAITTKYY